MYYVEPKLNKTDALNTIEIILISNVLCEYIEYIGHLPQAPKVIAE